VTGNPPRRDRDAGGPGALVIGSDYSGLGIVRSLGRRGITVWVIQHDGHVAASLSRYAKRRLAWPADDPGRIEFLLDLHARHGLDR
jgi:D-aspartate ligase